MLKNFVLFLFLSIILPTIFVGQSVGVVLSGGGASGLAHVGFLKALEENEIPIDYITNGVHLTSWISPENGEMLERYIGPRWRKHPGGADTLDMIEQLPDDELWSIHEAGKAKMIKMVTM